MIKYVCMVCMYYIALLSLFRLRLKSIVTINDNVYKKKIKEKEVGATLFGFLLIGR